jgi:hypothetical protein
MTTLRVTTTSASFYTNFITFLGGKWRAYDVNLSKWVVGDFDILIEVEIRPEVNH